MRQVDWNPSTVEGSCASESPWRRYPPRSVTDPVASLTESAKSWAWQFIPHRPFEKQMALMLAPEEEIFYGGAAGSAKSDAALMCAVQYANHPKYAALVLRKTYAELSKPGALMDRSRLWWANIPGVKWSEQDHIYRFPSGAKVAFGHCENDSDAYQYQGAEFQTIVVDELTEWNEAPYRFLFSRIRRLAGSNIPARMISTSNPGGVGHEWVKRRFIDGPPVKVHTHDDGTRTTSRTIRAVLADNPAIDADQYLRSLSFLDPVTRERLRNGDWIVTSEGAIFRREWFRFGPIAHPSSTRIRFWDMAATAGGGCRTAGVLMAQDVATGDAVIEHVVIGQWATGERDRVIEATADSDGPGVVVGWEEEGGSSGKDQSAAMCKLLRGHRLADWGKTRGGIHPTGPKVTRWGPLASQMQRGTVRLVSGPWSTAFVDELCAVTEDEEGFLDQADAAAGAYLYLSSKRATGLASADGRYGFDSRPERRDEFAPVGLEQSVIDAARSLDPNPYDSFGSGNPWDRRG